MKELSWLYPEPFIQVWNIDNTVIDHYGHVNNVAYISQLEALAWAHSNSLGLTIEHYRELDRGMVIRRHDIRYLLPCHAGQSLACATWIAACDKRLSLTRQFQFICTSRQKTVFTATTEFVCVALSSGLPKRMPEIYRSTYSAASIQVLE